MFKKYIFQIHWLLGITMGLVLSIVGITGALLSYEQEILRWINPDSYVVTAEQRALLTPSEIYQQFHQSNPEAKINSITVNNSPTEAAIVNIQKEGAKHGANVMINPYTAEALPAIQGTEFFNITEQIHRGFIFGMTGRQIVAISMLMLLFFIFSGIYLRWPGKHSIKQWLFLKPKLTGRSFLWNLHAIIGTWVVIFYLIFAVTGLTWPYSWWKNGFYAVLGVENTPSKKPVAVQLADPKTSKTSVLTTEEISQLLQKTWERFPQQIARDYSTLSMSIPSDNKSVNISFFDAIPQHERARNSATYRVDTDAFEKINLYADKPLNEKMAASIFPIHSGSFFGSTYHFLAMFASLLMPLFFVTGWLLYLNRRQQRRLALQARSHLQSVAVNTQSTEKPDWTIFFASQTGTAEQLAYDTAQHLNEVKIPCQVLPLSECSAQQLSTINNALFVVSTYGSGNAPDTALLFAKQQLHQVADLTHLNYAVLALGSQDYAETFCGFGIQLDQWLSQNKAHPLFEVIKVSNSDADSIALWYQSLSSITGKQISATLPQKSFSTWILSDRQCLNQGSLGAAVYQITLKPLNTQSWQAGDIAEIQCGNSKERLLHFIQQYNLDKDKVLPLLVHKDLTHIPTHWDKNCGNLPNLPIREYSIASTTQEGVIQLLIRQKINHHELGLGSGWMTQYAVLNQEILLHIRRNSSFHLADDNHPAIFIANGTGLAGLLGLIKQRNLNKQHQNWLLFGERQRQYDFFCATQIEQWQKEGHLQFVDCAFSRDQAHKIYVQDLLSQQATRLTEWINRGATIYVCGSLNGMAGSVDKALRQILGDTTVEMLIQQQRYKRDVY